MMPSLIALDWQQAAGCNLPQRNRLPNKHHQTLRNIPHKGILRLQNILETKIKGISSVLTSSCTHWVNRSKHWINELIIYAEQLKQLFYFLDNPMRYISWATFCALDKGLMRTFVTRYTSKLSWYYDHSTINQCVFWVNFYITLIWKNQMPS